MIQVFIVFWDYKGYGCRRLLKGSVLNPKQKPYERMAYMIRIDYKLI